MNTITNHGAVIPLPKKAREFEVEVKSPTGETIVLGPFKSEFEAMLGAEKFAREQFVRLQ